MSLREQVSQTVKKYEMLQDCTGILLAVSGGPDSMAMLHVFRELFPSYPMTVAHVHHNLRPEASAEAEQVAAYCKTMEIPYRIFLVNIPRYQPKDMSTEQFARDVRYAVLEGFATELGYSHIATAHHQDDNTETLFLHLLRGSGSDGARGIAPKRNQNGKTVIRPLINCEKSDILTYCNELNLLYATDRSNEDESYTRNYIRHTVIPALQQANPSVSRAITRFMASLEQDSEALDLFADAIYSKLPYPVPLAQIETKPTAILTRCIRRIVRERSDTVPNFTQTNTVLDMIREHRNGTVVLNGSYAVELSQGHLFVTDKTQDKILPPTTLQEGENTIPGFGTLTLTPAVQTDPPDPNRIRQTQPLFVRTRKTGDRFKGRGGSKSLKKIMIDRKIPKPLRNEILLLTDGTEILWASCLGSSATGIASANEPCYILEYRRESADSSYI